MKKVMYFIFRTGGNTRIVEVPITKETDKRITLDNKSEDYYVPSFVSVSQVLRKRQREVSEVLE